MPQTLIKNAQIVNEGSIKKGSLLIENETIADVFFGNMPNELPENITIINAEGKYLFPGIIDDQVHFREPGLTHKADIYTEAKAAVAGGITSFMEMPNTKPQTTTQKLLKQKFRLAAQKSLANYSFYFGATNENLNELIQIDPGYVCGVKVFMGSSTGNMLVDEPEALGKIFQKSPVLVATHCEDEQTIQKMTHLYKEKYGENVPVAFHAKIRNAEACFKSSSLAIELAKKYNTRLHILHLSTAKEMDLFNNAIPVEKKQITAEVCVHHLWFDDTDYEKLGMRIKWNPAIKSKQDKDQLLEALLTDKIDVVATDHAPHLWHEKQNTYFNAPSGGPMVQHSLLLMLEMYHQQKISLEKIVEKMCHNPAKLFHIKKRGFLRKGYKADIVLIDLNQEWKATDDTLLYKCKWSPLENYTFHSKITHTFINGHLAYQNGTFNESVKGQALQFSR